MKRPTTMAQYRDLIDQAVIELDELRASAEYDTAEFASSLGFLKELETQVKQLLAQVDSGEYYFGREDLLFMSTVAEQENHILPFKYMFEVINETHLNGLDDEMG